MDSSAYSVLAKTYDLQHNSYTPDIPMYIELARRLSPNAPVLEIGAGTGRVLIPLAQAGVAVVGIDNAPAMLGLGRARLAQAVAASSHAELIDADATDFDLQRAFGFAFVALNTFLHNQTQAAQLATLQHIRKHLTADGYVLIDLPPNDELANQPDDDEFQFEATMVDPSTQTQIDKYVNSRVHWATQEQELTYKVVEGKCEESVSFRLRHVFKHEMELLLHASGFAAPVWYGDYDLSDYQNDSPRMICLAQVA